MYHSDEDVDNRGGYAGAGAGSIWETSISTQLCYEPKTAQKISQCFFLWGGWGTRCSSRLSLKLDGTFPHLDFFL